MIAAAVVEPGRVEVIEVDDPRPGPGEVLVELRAAALNRRDLRVVGGGLAEIPGSDGAGVRRDTGDEVVICPLLGWGDSDEAPAAGWRILDGTWAELIAVPAENVHPRPVGYSWQEAAAFPLAALTAWRALFSRGRLGAGETVLVLGAGSGVSTFAVQLASYAGARVLVTSSSDEKIARAVELGAERGLRYDEGDWAGELEGTVDLVVDSVGSTWPESLRCLRPGGRVVAFGATGAAEVEVPVRKIFWEQLSIVGTTMGSPREFAALLRTTGSWRPVVDSVRPLAEVGAALERLRAGAQLGKLVLEIA